MNVSPFARFIALSFHFFFQAEDGIRDLYVTGVQTCALPIRRPPPDGRRRPGPSLLRPLDVGRRSLPPPRVESPRSSRRHHNEKARLETEETPGPEEGRRPPEEETAHKAQTDHAPRPGRLEPRWPRDLQLPKRFPRPHDLTP